MARGKINTDDSDGKESNTNPITEIVSILDAEGPGALFSGLGPRASRAIASGAIQFASYEMTQNALLKR
jgi:Mitochondrial carrier protein